MKVRSDRKLVQLIDVQTMEINLLKNWYEIGEGWVSFLKHFHVDQKWFIYSSFLEAHGVAKRFVYGNERGSKCMQQWVKLYQK